MGRSSAVRWTQAELCALQATSRLSFQMPRAVGLVWDAGRIGRPAVDLNFTMAEKLGEARVVLLSPAVFFKIQFIYLKKIF